MALEALMWSATIVLVMCSALFSGLTLGLLSLDKIELEVVAAGEDANLAACARKIIPVRKNGNLLLCTFLIGNTSVNSLSSILMADLTGGLLGFLISTFAILFFGEIIPQAVCSRYALQIGARVIYLVYFFRALFYPLAKPISMLLDYALGEEIGTIHTRQELSKLLQIHVTRGAIDAESGNILQGALHALNVMRISELVTPIDEVYMLPLSAILDFKTVSDIFETGFSRIPVYDEKKEIVSVLFAKDLILVDPDDEISLKYFVSIFGRKVVSFSKDLPVRTAFVKLKQGHSHLALVKDISSSDISDSSYTLGPKRESVVGVVTLEDIVEEIIQDTIEDETDIAEKIPATTRSKFRLLNASSRDSILSSEEVKALAIHLMTNVDQVRASKIGWEALKWVLQQSTVQVIEDPNFLIYEANKPANFSVIVLTGKLQAASGLGMDIGSFSIVAPEALFDAEYIAPTSVRIGSDKARIVIVKRSTVEAGQRSFSESARVPTNPLVRHEFAMELLRKKTAEKFPRSASDPGDINSPS